MPEIIKDFYVNGEFARRVVRIIPDEVKKQIGEILTAPIFEQLVFEENVKEGVRLMLEQAKKGTINLLFYGTQGTGKTMCAKMFAVETKRAFIYLNGNMQPRKIQEILSNAKDNSIVLIDEIHNLRESIAELLYSAIQDNELFVDGVRIPLNLMFIATTTEPERLPKPLLDRFKLVEFEELGKEKLSQILLKKYEQNVVDYLLNFTTNWRIVNNLIEMVMLYGDVNEENLHKVFRLKKINMYSGFSELQEKYLAILKKMTKPIGLRQLAIRLRKSEDYIKGEIEPDLIRKDMILISSRGREIIQEFKEHLPVTAEKKKFDKDDRDLAIAYLRDRKGITEKLGKRYLELVCVCAEMIANKEDCDTIDFSSFSDDKSIKDSIKENYICDL